MTFHEKSMVLRGFRSPDASGMNYIPMPGPWTFFMTFLKFLKILFFVNRKFFLRDSSILIRNHYQCVIAGFAWQSLLHGTLSQDTCRVVLSDQNRAAPQEKFSIHKKQFFQKIQKCHKECPWPGHWDIIHSWGVWTPKASQNHWFFMKSHRLFKVLLVRTSLQ